MAATPYGVLRLEHRHTYNDRVLARVEKQEGFVWKYDRDTVVIHTRVDPAFFEEAVHVVWIDNTGQYIARVIGTEEAVAGAIRLVLSPFMRLQQDVEQDDDMSEQGFHLWARTSWRKIDCDETTITPPRTLPD